MVPSDLESEVAQKFIDAHFPGSSDQATTLIVLTSADALDNHTKQVVNEISNELVLNKSYPGGPIDTSGNVTVRVDSLYSTLQSYILSFLVQIHSGYQVAQNLTNLTGFMLFGLPLQYQSLWYEVNASAFTLYGLASAHAANWIAINQTSPRPGHGLRHLHHHAHPGGGAEGRETKDAIINAMRNIGGVITACGIIMAGAFGRSCSPRARCSGSSASP